MSLLSPITFQCIFHIHIISSNSYCYQVKLFVHLTHAISGYLLTIIFQLNFIIFMHISHKTLDSQTTISPPDFTLITSSYT